MKEGGLQAPTRHAIPWQDPDFTDRAKTEAEMQRVFDICQGCRRCFNLCDSFPRLFDLIDASPTGEVDGVASADYRNVADACTLCDMCYMTKCPYVPPHEYNLDFPHLMLRYRAVELREGRVSRRHRQLINTDRNGKLAGTRGAVRQLGERSPQSPAPLADGKSGRHRPPGGIAGLSPADFRHAREERRAGHQFQRARDWAQGRTLRDLFRELQQSEHRRGGPGGAGAQRGRHRGGLSALLRYAAARTGRCCRGRDRGAQGRGGAVAMDRRGATTSSRSCRPVH